MRARKTSGIKKKPLNTFEQVYDIVRKIPRGKVFTYGHISRLMNGRLSAAAVGWALNGLRPPEALTPYNSDTVPWHRVVNSSGGISTRHETKKRGADGKAIKLQQVMLEKEGVAFSADGRIDLTRYLWKADASEKKGTPK